MKIDRDSWRTDAAPRFDPETNRAARISAALGYLFFFIPLVMHPESKFGRYHANQSLLLLLLMTLGVAVLAQIPYIGPLLIPAAAAFAAACTLRGFVTALRCQAKHIPLLGKLILIEYEDRCTLEA